MKGLRHLTIWMCVLAAVLEWGHAAGRKDEDVRVDMTAPAKDRSGRAAGSYGYGISMEVMTTRPRVSWSS